MVRLREVDAETALAELATLADMGLVVIARVSRHSSGLNRDGPPYKVLCHTHGSAGFRELQCLRNSLQEATSF
jgi:hypothetical protein